MRLGLKRRQRATNRSCRGCCWCWCSSDRLSSSWRLCEWGCELFRAPHWVSSRCSVYRHSNPFFAPFLSAQYARAPASPALLPATALRNQSSQQFQPSISNQQRDPTHRTSDADGVQKWQDGHENYPYSLLEDLQPHQAILVVARGSGQHAVKAPL